MPRILLALALAASLAAAPPAFFDFLASIWSESGSHIDPNGDPAPQGDEGSRIDPNGATASHSDEGPELDPNG
jgi:hypothetical protein